MNEKGFQKLVFKPQKLLGQNFLTSPLHLAKIVSASKIDNKSSVVEIGAGYGSLTTYIQKANPWRFISIEKDPNLFSWLNSNLPFHKEQSSFLLADVLEVKWEELLKPSLDSQQKVIIVGNLPYGVANKLIIKLVRKQQLFERLVFLVQREVAQRWVANNIFHKNKYSSLSIFLNYFCKTELLFNVSKYFFKPLPPVDGAVVSFEFREDLPVNFATESFFTFSRNCFRFRRKTLLNNLKSFHGREALIKSVFTRLNLHEKTRPQDLSTEQYFKLFMMLKDLS